MGELRIFTVYTTPSIAAERGSPSFVQKTRNLTVLTCIGLSLCLLLLCMMITMVLYPLLHCQLWWVYGLGCLGRRKLCPHMVGSHILGLGRSEVCRGGMQLKVAA